MVQTIGMLECLQHSKDVGLEPFQRIGRHPLQRGTRATGPHHRPPLLLVRVDEIDLFARDLSVSQPGLLLYLFQCRWSLE